MSKNGIALAVLLIEAGLSAVGVEFEPMSVERVVEGVIIAAALIAAVINQYKRPDTKWFLLKK